MKKIFFAVSFLSILAACKKTDTTDSSVSVQTNYTNVAYGTDPSQVMDVYLPPNRTVVATNVIVMIHGGGWNSGDKSDFQNYIDTIQRRFPSYAIFNINYRLAGAAFNLFPTQSDDVKTAIEFIYSKRNDYKISDNYALLGASAGAHLALLQSYKYTNPIRVRSVIDFFGPADMTEMYNNPSFPGGEIPILNVVGTIPALNSVIYSENSPINYVTHDVPPTIILHGGADIVVRHEQSDSLFTRLTDSTVASEYVQYPTQNHGWSNADTLTDSFDHIQVFLTAHMP